MLWGTALATNNPSKYFFFSRTVLYSIISCHMLGCWGGVSRWGWGEDSVGAGGSFRSMHNVNGGVFSHIDLPPLTKIRKQRADKGLVSTRGSAFPMSMTYINRRLNIECLFILQCTDVRWPRPPAAYMVMGHADE